MFSRWRWPAFTARCRYKPPDEMAACGTCYVSGLDVRAGGESGESGKLRCQGAGPLPSRPGAYRPGDRWRAVATYGMAAQAMSRRRTVSGEFRDASSAATLFATSL
jgi:hypothetical protein